MDNKGNEVADKQQKDQHVPRIDITRLPSLIPNIKRAKNSG